MNAARGPWSANATFRAAGAGYIRNNEVYDPLVNGQTVGEIVGDVTFIPNVGVRLEHPRQPYSLPPAADAAQGEFSIIVTDVATNTEGGKTKVMAMSEALHDIVTNDRRLTVEKRGDPGRHRGLALHFARGPDRYRRRASASSWRSMQTHAYLWTATWNGFFNVGIQRGGSTVTDLRQGQTLRRRVRSRPRTRRSSARRSGGQGRTVPRCPA